jgi:L-lactate dehydrogenase complex protein LldE
MRVAFFATCLADSFFAGSALAATRVLRRLGVEVVVPADQTCCGQPAFNAGYHAEAAAMAAHTRRVFAGADAVVLPSGSCAAMIRRHYHELPDDARATGRDLAERTWELTEFIVKVLGVTELGDGLRGTHIAWHHGCHALRELGVRDEPLALLRNAGATLIDWPAAEECCGFGGIFSVKMPEVSGAMADRKIETAREAGAEAEAFVGAGAGAGGSGSGVVLSSTDAGCLMQLSGRLRRVGSGMRVAHVADLLWQAMGTGAGKGAV